MASDITEDFQVDITNQSTAVIATENTGVTYDVAFNGKGFFDASSEQNPYRRQTAPYKKDQNDNSAEPGEQSLSGWWLRSQSSFHYGAGITFFEPSQEQGYVQNQTIRFRYTDSQGVDVWTPGEVTLLKDVVAGHNVTGSVKTNLRPIRYSSTDSVLMLDGGDVDKILADGTVVHYIDHNTGTDTNVYAICDDGNRSFWVTNQYTSAKCQIFTKDLDKTSSDTNTSMYYDNSVGVSSAVIEYAKGRLIAGINNKIYELDPNNTGGTNLPTAIFTAKESGYIYTSITDSPSNIYIAGYNGIQSQIRMLTYSATVTGGVPVIDGAVVVAEMPRGEIVHSIKYYLGYMLIGTSRGARVAQVDTNGGIVYGPLLFETTQPVYQFATTDHYAWCTAQIASDAGLVRIDLAAPIDNLVFPYANDLQAVGSAKVCTGASFLGESNRLVFTSAGGYVYVESGSVLRSTGYVKTGKIRFSTLEDKFFKYIKERADYSGGGSIGISTTTASIITVDATTGNNDVGITETNAADVRQFIFTLNRNGTTTSQGPVFYGYQLKALPAAKKQRLMQYNVYCFDKEKDRYGNFNGYDGRAYTRLTEFEDMEATSDIVTVQDYRTGETFQALIEECSFTGKTAPTKNFNGFGGVLTITVRKIS